MKILFKNNKLISKEYTKEIDATQGNVFNYVLLNAQKKGNSTTMSCSIPRNELYNLIRDKNLKTINNLKVFLDKFSEIKIDLVSKDSIMSTRLIHTVKYDETIDSFECRFEEELYKAATEYDSGYTPLNLENTSKSRNIYTLRLYEEFRRWSNIKSKIEMTIIELKKLMFIDGAYSEYKDFKRKIILPALETMNKEMNMKVEFKEIKTCRKVTSIEFYITDYEPRKYNFEKSKIIEPKRASVDAEVVITNDDIDSLDYMNLIDLNVNESIHTIFLQDFSDYKNYMVVIETASNKTLAALGSKTINKRNYKYFKTTLKNLLPSEEITL